MEGDWITLALFLFFFIILPLLQGLRRKRPPEQLPEAEDDWEAAPGPSERPQQQRRIEPEEWVDDWDEAPAKEERGARARSAWEELGLDDFFEPAPKPEPRPELKPAAQPEPRPDPRPEPVWKPAPVPAPRPRVEASPPVRAPASRPALALSDTASTVVSLENLYVDREAEHARFHERYVAPASAAARGAALPGLAPDLRDPREIRRAIIVAEVLGPPRALRDHETRG